MHEFDHNLWYIAPDDYTIGSADSKAFSVTYIRCSAPGKKRLRQVAKQCVNDGQRVQNSVFECVLDAAQLVRVKHILGGLSDKERDSLRFYNLGNRHQSKVEHVGAKTSFRVEETLMV